MRVEQGDTVRHREAGAAVLAHEDGGVDVAVLFVNDLGDQELFLRQAGGADKQVEQLFLHGSLRGCRPARVGRGRTDDC